MLKSLRKSVFKISGRFVWRVLISLAVVVVVALLIKMSPHSGAVPPPPLFPTTKG